MEVSQTWAVLREGRRGKEEGKKDGIHLVLQPNDEPNKTDNRTTGHEKNLNTPNQIALGLLLEENQ